MMYNEFLELAGQDITYKQYTEVIEPMYTASEQMSKREFIDFMMPSIKAMAKENKAKKEAERIANQKTVFISSGAKTPNGCYYLGKYGKLVSEEAKIKTGKVIVKVRELTDEEEKEQLKHWDLYLGYTVDYFTGLENVIIKWVK